MIELRVQELLQASYEKGEISPFDLAVEQWGAGDEVLVEAKTAADMLVSLRLARYVDEGRTRLAPTNAGRYWALHGGFLAFLKEEPEKANGGKSKSPEVEALRTITWHSALRRFGGPLACLQRVFSSRSSRLSSQSSLARCHTVGDDSRRGGKTKCQNCFIVK